MNTTWRNNRIPSPCTKDCPDRKGGCQINCPRWAEYVKKRDEEYAQRLAIIEGRYYSPAQERTYRETARRKKSTLK